MATHSKRLRLHAEVSVVLRVRLNFYTWSNGRISEWETAQNKLNMASEIKCILLLMELQ